MHPSLVPAYFSRRNQHATEESTMTAYVVFKTVEVAKAALARYPTLPPTCDLLFTAMVSKSWASTSVWILPPPLESMTVTAVFSSATCHSVSSEV